MDIKKYDEIIQKLEQSLDHKRFVHTLGVAYTSASMAMSFGENIDRAFLAGLLHDCAKCFNDQEKFRLCQEGGVQLSEFEKKNTALIHAKLGVYIAKRDYGVEEKDILDAIRTHTTGEPGMSLLQKIVFTADLIEPHRSANLVPDMELIRELAFKDIDECIYVVTKGQLQYLEGDSSKEVDPMTRMTYNYYKLVHDQRN